MTATLKRHHPRIALWGQYLDEVRIRWAQPYVYPVYYLSFPAHRHWARVEAQLAIDPQRFLVFLPGLQSVLHLSRFLRFISLPAKRGR